MSDKPKPAWWERWQRLLARKKPPKPVPPLPPRPAEARPLKGVILPRCYKGHMYTPETTGTRLMAGNVVRKCLVCAEERRNRGNVIEVKHGTLYAYRRHKCRCVECRQANTDTRRRQRMKGN